MENSEIKFYHIYNRGVEKRQIFEDKADRIRFIHDLYEFNDMSPALPFARSFEKDKRACVREKLVEIACFSLMPNHHHLLLGETKEEKRSLFVKKLHGGYARAFNEKYKRSGYLFQGSYKKVLIKTGNQLLQVVCYIHANPLDLWKPNWREKRLTLKEIEEALNFLENYRWSSHLDYLGKENFPSVINREFLERVFAEYGGYESFFSRWLEFFKRENEDLKGVRLE